MTANNNRESVKSSNENLHHHISTIREPQLPGIGTGWKFRTAALLRIHGLNKDIPNPQHIDIEDSR